MPNSRVVIVGGGVIGVCCAYHLVKQGIEVVVLERGEIGEGASYGSAGVIAPGHPPMNKPDRVKQALKRMFDSKTPLYIKPRFDPRWRCGCCDLVLIAPPGVLEKACASLAHSDTRLCHFLRP